MAKSSEPWEHKLGGLANKGETQFHADDDDDNSDDNDDNGINDGDVAKDDDNGDDDEKVGGKRKCCWINSGVGQENRLRGVQNIFHRSRTDFHHEERCCGMTKGSSKFDSKTFAFGRASLSDI